MKPGISSYTYTWAIGFPGKQPKHPMNIYQLIEKADELGVCILQVADNLSLDAFSSSDLFNIREFSKRSNVHIEIGARKMTLENLKKYIELAVFFDSAILRFVIDGEGFYPCLEEVHKIIRCGLPLLEENKIVLAIENHDRFKAAEFAEIIERAGSDKVGICLDSVNSMGAGEGLETVIEKLAPFTVNLHIKDFTIQRMFHQMGFIVAGCPLGKGMLPVEDLIRKVPLRCTSAILEQWTPPEETQEKTIEKEDRWAKLSISHLKNILS